MKLERITWRQGRKVTSVTYALTSVSRERASTADLLGWLRGRWGIENRAFWVRVEIEIVEAPGETLAADRARQSANELEAARVALADDSTARALQERFGATLHPETVRPTGK